MSYFEQHREAVSLAYKGSLVRSGRSSGNGLRRAQIGAVYALASHFTTTREPGVVAMPTGSGKTAVMIILPYLLGSNRILVVTPSKPLRQQIGAEFSSLRILSQSGAAVESMTRPRTKAVASRLSDRDAWEQLDGYDVIVGTPNVLSPGSPGVVAPPSGFFDLVIFDEAHHVPAPTYTALLESLPQVPARNMGCYARCPAQSANDLPAAAARIP